MYLFIFMVIALVLGVVIIKKIDQRRWQRYQIDRDLFYRNHPYELSHEQEFNVIVKMDKSAQFKLINGLMLKSLSQPVLKKAMIQRERVLDSEKHQFVIKVMVRDINIGYLEHQYAEQFCQCLKKTEFYVGRPISIWSELTIFRNSAGEHTCRVKLGLPVNPNEIINLMSDKASSKA